jgi:endonuclease YncB( thermonuclease family)
MVFLQNIDTEKYGRVLADVYLEGSGTNEEQKQSISEWMLENHYAVAYNGGTKVAWTSSSSHAQEREQEKEKKEEESRDLFYKISTW